MQTVSTRFNQLANGDVRPHSWGIRMSFDKQFDDDVTFFTLDQSLLDGVDLLAPSDDNPIQAWDYYEYKDYSDRVMYMSVSRKIDFPYSVVSSLADFQLNNYDQYFTPNSASPISQYILPKRPVRLLQGLSNTLLPQFVGLTQGMPDISRNDGTATFTAMDFLTWIYDMPIRNTIAMRDVRTDEVLANIFQQFGLNDSQYSLGKGRNTIRFLFFDKEQTKAGDIIRPLMQAEMGRLWLDEQGIIRFTPRLEQPMDPVYTFDEDSLVSVSTSGDDNIINKAIINTHVREVQEWQTVYTKSDTDNTLNVIPPNSAYVFEASLKDPCLEIIDPTIGQNSGVSWFTVALPNGTIVGDVDIESVVLRSNSYDITFVNNNSFAVNVNQLYLWGQPAKQITVDPVVYENKDVDSIAKYDEQVYEITNNFVQDISSSRSLAITMLNDYSEYADIVDIETKGNPAIQLADIVEIDYKEYSGNYRIIEISNRLQDNKYTQLIKCRKYDPRTYFTLDVSLLDGTDILAP